MLTACAGSKPLKSFIELGKYVKVAKPTRTAEIIAEAKNERLIAFIADLSVERRRVIKIPITAVRIPIAGTMSG